MITPPSRRQSSSRHSSCNNGDHDNNSSSSSSESPVGHCPILTPIRHVQETYSHTKEALETQWRLFWQFYRHYRQRLLSLSQQVVDTTALVSQKITSPQALVQEVGPLLSSFLQQALCQLQHVWLERCSPETRQTVLTALAMTVLSLLGYRRLRKHYASRSRQTISKVYTSADTAPLSLLYQAAKDGAIQKALLASSGGVIYYLLGDGTWKQSRLPSSPLSQRDLLDQLSQTCSDWSVLPAPVSSTLYNAALAASPFLYLAVLYQMMKNMMGGADIAETTHSQSSITFRDVAALPEVVTEVSEVVTYLQQPERYQSVGAHPPRGILLHGAPGTGKTLLAQAVAGQAKVDAFLACSASDFVQVYVGRGAARVRALFAQVKQQARRKRFWERLLVRGGLRPATSSVSYRKPTAILFIDELDALAKTRAAASSWNGNDEREQTLNALLTEMDGFATNRTAPATTTKSLTPSKSDFSGRRGMGDNVHRTTPSRWTEPDDNDDDDDDDDDDVTLIVIAATNRADVLDPAMLRRFDRIIHVGYPDAALRKDILQIHARRIACDATGGLDWDTLASDALTGGCSGADLRNIINDAACLAVREGAGRVTQRHLEHAARRSRQMRTHGTLESPLSTTPTATRMNALSPSATRPPVLSAPDTRYGTPRRNDTPEME